MTKLSASLIAAAVALSLSACDRPGSRPPATNPDHECTSARYNSESSASRDDPSVPPNPHENQPKDPSVSSADWK